MGRERIEILTKREYETKVIFDIWNSSADNVLHKIGLIVYHAEKNLGRDVDENRNDY